MVYRNATIKNILKNKEVQLLDSFFGSLPESSFSEKIYKLRKMHGLSREDFGDRIGRHSATIKSWEFGEKKPTNTSLKKILSAFGLGEAYFE